MTWTLRVVRCTAMPLSMLDHALPCAPNRISVGSMITQGMNEECVFHLALSVSVRPLRSCHLYSRVSMTNVIMVACENLVE